MNTLKGKVDLTLLKRLVLELESSIAEAEKKSDSVTSSYPEFAVEMFKASGLCAGIVKEATLLVSDISYCLSGTQSQEAFLEKILSLTKNDNTGGN